MSVPERDIVDSRIEGAREKARQLTDLEARLKAQMACDLVEAVVRSIRDHDDTQATVVKPAIADGFNDLGPILNAIGGEVGAAIAARLDKRR